MDQKQCVIPIGRNYFSKETLFCITARMFGSIIWSLHLHYFIVLNLLGGRLLPCIYRNLGTHPFFSFSYFVIICTIPFFEVDLSSRLNFQIYLMFFTQFEYFVKIILKHALNRICFSSMFGYNFSHTTQGTIKYRKKNDFPKVEQWYIYRHIWL